MRRPHPLGVQLAAIFAVRVAVNASQRIIYPFLPAIARGLGISLAAATSLVGLRMLPGLAAPLLGPVADRIGRRGSMELALLACSSAGVLLATAGGVGWAGAGLLLVGLGKVLLDPSVYAFVGDAVPYERRGRIIGLLELNWATAWLLGVPVAGFLIERFGWQAPWAALAVAGLLGAGILRWLLPGRPSAASATARDSLLVRALSLWRTAGRRRSVIALLGACLLLTLAIEIPFIVYGAWLEEAFHLSLSRLGLASVAIGAAEVAAELGSSVLTDRMGKVRSVLAGLLGMALALVVLPFASRLGLAGALVGLSLVVLCFEFAIVSILPLATEIVPTARASLLSFNVMAVTSGRLLGSIAGGWLWQWQVGDIALNALLGAGCALAAALLIRLGLTEGMLVGRQRNPA